MIELRNITKEYITPATKVEALKGVSLCFRNNEFVAILGPSGGGKTTLLNIIGGLDKYTSGDLIINGKSTVNFKDKDWDTYRNHSVGFVFQSYNLIPHQSVVQNVELALTIGGIGEKERRKRALDALDSVGLLDQAYKKPNQLSGGQMQRVAIARALVNNPDILLADEPTGALDTQSSLQITDILKEVASDRLVVMVTHNPDLANTYANRIIRLTDGQIIDDSNPFNGVEDNRTNKAGNASMGLFTAFGLSLNNLLTKKARTILVSLAGSIGIIGIALIMSLSNGVNRYIEDVQKDSLSAYPLSIENSDIDMTQMMLSMMGTVKNTDKQDGRIVETPVVSDAFNQIGANNLEEFKKHLESKKAEVDPLMTAIKYNYGIKPYVYKYDTTDKIIRINPSGVRTNSAFSSYSFSDTFQEMLDNKSLLDSQYDIVAGNWPQKYDELVLVVQDRTTVSDFMMYNLGYRDPQDLRDYMTKIMNGEKITIDNKPLSLTYDELLQLKYRLVIPADYYRYDEKYQVWENMSDDEDYLKDLIDNGLTLRVVGIVTPKDGVSSTVMQPGIGYLPSLTRYIVEQSGSREVVRQQLQDHEVDVFTHKTFEEVNDRDAEKNNLDFDEMFTIDKDKIAKAFGGNVSEKEMQKLISKYVSEAVNSVSTDTSVAKQALNEGFQKIMGKTAGLYIEEKGMDGTAFFTAEDIPGMVEKGMSDKESKQVLSDLEKEYVIPKEMYSQFYSGLISGLLQGYFEQYSAMMGGKAVLNSAMLETMVKMAMSTDQMADALSNMAAAMSEARMKSAVGTSMATMSGAIISKMAAAMKVDPDKLAEAFSFNMTEEDLTRLMNTYMNNSNSDITYDGNLRKLGYSDMVTPISIAFYIKDFEAKDTFKQFIEDYNTMMINSDRKENKIIYTDITGILISSVSNIINAISYVLIAFVSISLVVSSIMIGIITYISVLERTKEIGILRSLGASKGNVANVFNAETFIIGLCAGTFGVVLTTLLCYPINHMVRKLTNIPSLTAYLPLRTGLILIGISVVLTIIAGLIPSRMAMNCDPVTALRTE